MKIFASSSVSSGDIVADSISLSVSTPLAGSDKCTPSTDNMAPTHLLIDSMMVGGSNIQDDPVVKNHVNNLIELHAADIHSYEDTVTFCESQVQELQHQCDLLKKENEVLKGATNSQVVQPDSSAGCVYIVV